MRKGFFDGLSETLTRTTKDLSKKAGQIYETQKIQRKVSSEEHMVEKLKCVSIWMLSQSTRMLQQI